MVGKRERIGGRFKREGAGKEEKKTKRNFLFIISRKGSKKEGLFSVYI